jgi:hypothetical protein
MGEGETFQIHHEFVTECRHGHVSNAHLRKALYYAVEGPSATDATPREVTTAGTGNRTGLKPHSLWSWC